MTHKFPDLWKFSETLYRTGIKGGKRDTISQTTNGIESNYIGKIGEWAFGQMFGLEVDLSFTRKNDGGIDFHAPFGTVDVKTRIYKPGRLDMFVDVYDRDGLTQSNLADIYVMMYVRMPEEEPLAGGYISREELTTQDKVQINGKTVYFVPFGILRPLNELKGVR